jgi:hypothetical protein
MKFHTPLGSPLCARTPGHRTLPRMSDRRGARQAKHLAMEVGWELEDCPGRSWGAHQRWSTAPYALWWLARHIHACPNPTLTLTLDGHGWRTRCSPRPHTRPRGWRATPTPARSSARRTRCGSPAGPRAAVKEQRGVTYLICCAPSAATTAFPPKRNEPPYEPCENTGGRRCAWQITSAGRRASLQAQPDSACSRTQ